MRRYIADEEEKGAADSFLQINEIIGRKIRSCRISLLFFIKLSLNLSADVRAHQQSFEVFLHSYREQWICKVSAKRIGMFGKLIRKIDGTKTIHWTSSFSGFSFLF